MREEEKKRAGGNKGAPVQMSAKSKQSPNPTSQVLGFQCQVLLTYLQGVFLSKGYTKSLMDYMNICTEKYAAKKTTHEKKQASYSQ